MAPLEIKVILLQGAIFQPWLLNPQKKPKWLPWNARSHTHTQMHTVFLTKKCPWNQQNLLANCWKTHFSALTKKHRVLVAAAAGNFAKVDPRVDELCKYLMTLSCGSYADNATCCWWHEHPSVIGGFLVGWLVEVKSNGSPSWSKPENGLWDDECITRFLVSNILYFRPYLGRWSNLTNIFQMGWFNHQPNNYQGFRCTKRESPILGLPEYF